MGLLGRVAAALLPESFALCSTLRMSKTDPTERLVAAAYHGLRSDVKKQRKRDPLAEEREDWRRYQEREESRYSEYPPGWNGEGW